MKVDLVRERESPWAPVKGCQVARMAPFVMKATGRVHRVRSARIFAHDPDAGGWNGRRYHVAVTFWCGSSGFLDAKNGRRDLLLHDIPEGSVLCATCEGRAIGAGQPSAAWLVPPDRDLIFTPRTA